jgi:hypothetical protein
MPYVVAAAAAAHQCCIEVEGLSAFSKAQPQECVTARGGILNTQHKVAAADTLQACAHTRC